MPDTSLAYESSTGVRCARCRAIIESLPDDAACPACGLGVGLAKAGLLHADPLWLRPVRRGLLLLGFAPVVGILFAAAYALPSSQPRRGISPQGWAILGVPGPQSPTLRLPELLSQTTAASPTAYALLAVLTIPVVALFAVRRPSRAFIGYERWFAPRRLLVVNSYTLAASLALMIGLPPAVGGPNILFWGLREICLLAFASQTVTYCVLYAYLACISFALNRTYVACVFTAIGVVTIAGATPALVARAGGRTHFPPWAIDDLLPAAGVAASLTCLRLARVLNLTLRNKSPLWPPQRVPVAPARYVSPKRRALSGAAAAAVALSAYVGWSLYIGPAPVLAFRVDDGKSYPYFDPTGSSAAVIGYYSTQPGLYSIRTGERVARFGTHEEIIVRAAFSADGKRMVTAGIDRMLRVWDVPGDRQLRSFDHGGNRVSAYALAVSPDGRYAAYALMDSYAPGTTANPVTTLFDLDRGTVCFTLAGKGSLPMSLVFSDDGSKLLSIDLAGNVFLHDVATGARLATANPASYVGGGCLGPDGTTVYLTGRELWSWDLTSGALKRMWTLPHLCRCVAASPDAKRLLTGGEDAVRVWDAATGKELAHYRRRSGPIIQLAFSPDGTLAISADAGGSVQAWQLP